MSRCILDDEAKDTGVVIGWDPGTETFFAQVHNYRLPERDSSVRWTGSVDGRTYDVPDELIKLIQPYAAKHDPQVLRRELMKDKAADDGERKYGFDKDGALEEPETWGDEE